MLLGELVQALVEVGLHLLHLLLVALGDGRRVDDAGEHRECGGRGDQGEPPLHFGNCLPRFLVMRWPDGMGWLQE